MCSTHLLNTFYPMGPVLRGEAVEINKDASCQWGTVEICAQLKSYLAHRKYFWMSKEVKSMNIIFAV